MKKYLHLPSGRVYDIAPEAQYYYDEKKSGVGAHKSIVEAKGSSDWKLIEDKEPVPEVAVYVLNGDGVEVPINKDGRYAYIYKDGDGTIYDQDVRHRGIVYNPPGVMMFTNSQAVVRYLLRQHLSKSKEVTLQDAIRRIEILENKINH